MLRVSKKITSALKGQTIRLVEIGDENILIRMESNLEIEIWHDLFFDGDELISDGGMKIEVRDENDNVIQRS